MLTAFSILAVEFAARLRGVGEARLVSAEPPLSPSCAGERPRRVVILESSSASAGSAPSAKSCTR
jgi:hypothetical protein